MNILNTIKKLLHLLSSEEKKQVSLLLVLIFINACINVIGVASIMPLLAVLANPEIIETSTIIKSIYIKIESPSIQDFYFILGVLSFLILLISLGFQAITVYAQLKFSLLREYSISSRLLSKYLEQSYSWFLNNNKSDIGKTILSEVREVIDRALLPMINLVAQGIVVIALIILIIIVDPKLAISVVLILIFSYLIIFKLMEKFLSQIGIERVKANQERFTVINETFNALKLIKVTRLEKLYQKKYNIPANIYAKNQASAQIVSQLPRFFVEAIAFGGMILLMLYLMSIDNNLSRALPIISVYAFVGYRLIPAVQQLYASITSLKFSENALNVLNTEIKKLDNNKIILNNDINKLEFNNNITLSNISYKYPNAVNYTLSELNICFKSNSCIALVGETGSGKSTIIDIILGLIEPIIGKVTIDDSQLNQSNLKNWHKKIGYVPQQIYISNDSIINNIAFGIEKNKIDYENIIKVSKIINMHDFISRDLPNGYDTIIGEDGVRLSGGQIQCIGIARALYCNPKLLILDEATSALDNLTEKFIMNNIHNLKKEMTIIIIAHRLHILKDCDDIFVLENGNISGQGNYSYLEKNNKLFQNLTNSIK